MKKLVDWLIKRRNKQLHIHLVESASNSEKQFRRVLNTLRENKIMVITKEDGIYIRLVGDVEKEECWID